MANKEKKSEESQKSSVVQQAPYLLSMYRDSVVSAMMEEFHYNNVMQVPRIEKVVLSMGLGEAVTNPNIAQKAVEELSIIAGQTANITRAKKSISNFKLREGMPIGCRVTLRKRNMWNFLYRLVGVALPRVRDFRGLSLKAFDGHGNYSLGLKEQVLFPEINYDSIDKVRGFNVAIVTSAQTDGESRSMLKHLGLPFRK